MRTLLAVVIVLCCAMPASAGRVEELTPYFSTQYFTWQERIDGRRLLKEEGPLFSVGARLGAVTDSSLTVRGKAELFGSEVGYRGETQAPNPAPVHTRVTYLGTEAEADLGYRLRPAVIVVEPFGGIGYRYWLRDLQDSRTSDGTQVSGYTEEWMVGYCRLGARAATTAAGMNLVAAGAPSSPSMWEIPSTSPAAARPPSIPRVGGAASRRRVGVTAPSPCRSTTKAFVSSVPTSRWSKGPRTSSPIPRPTSSA
ncbi:hypothetical protein [Geomonas subterranea]|uniref:hypothetical protein n=1 Tax=Geomonas subterranea TaxID=2847989 RepID=UPI001EF12D09|nr:hypothetical protein [Geomonas subterranea]